MDAGQLLSPRPSDPCTPLARSNSEGGIGSPRGSLGDMAGRISSADMAGLLGSPVGSEDGGGGGGSGERVGPASSRRDPTGFGFARGRPPLARLLSPRGSRDLAAPPRDPMLGYTNPNSGTREPLANREHAAAEATAAEEEPRPATARWLDMGKHGGAGPLEQGAVGPACGVSGFEAAQTGGERGQGDPILGQGDPASGVGEPALPAMLSPFARQAGARGAAAAPGALATLEIPGAQDCTPPAAAAAPAEQRQGPLSAAPALPALAALVHTPEGHTPALHAVCGPLEAGASGVQAALAAAQPLRHVQQPAASATGAQMPVTDAGAGAAEPKDGAAVRPLQSLQQPVAPAGGTQMPATVPLEPSATVQEDSAAVRPLRGQQEFAGGALMPAAVSGATVLAHESSVAGQPVRPVQQPVSSVPGLRLEDLLSAAPSTPGLLTSGCPVDLPSGHPAGPPPTGLRLEDLLIPPAEASSGGDGGGGAAAPHAGTQHTERSSSGAGSGGAGGECPPAGHPAGTPDTGLCLGDLLSAPPGPAISSSDPGSGGSWGTAAPHMGEQPLGRSAFDGSDSRGTHNPNVGEQAPEIRSLGARRSADGSSGGSGGGTGAGRQARVRGWPAVQEEPSSSGERLREAAGNAGRQCAPALSPGRSRPSRYMPVHLAVTQACTPLALE